MFCKPTKTPISARSTECSSLIVVPQRTGVIFRNVSTWCIQVFRAFVTRETRLQHTTHIVEVQPRYVYVVIRLPIKHHFQQPEAAPPPCIAQRNSGTLMRRVGGSIKLCNLVFNCGSPLKYGVFLCFHERTPKRSRKRQDLFWRFR